MTVLNPREKHRDIAITALGMLTPAGYSKETNLSAIDDSEKIAKSREDFSLKSFKPAKVLSDRRMLKAVSYCDGLGLAAIEDLKNHPFFQSYSPEKFGLYVGAQESAYHDNENYKRSMLETDDGRGKLKEKEFGVTCMSAKPTTLLLGLPNNVLCYGSMILGTEGPNNNYTASDVGAHMALFHAARALKIGKVDASIAGGASALTYKLINHMYKLQNHWSEDLGEVSPYKENQHGYLNSDGAAFAMLEKSSQAKGVSAYYVGCKFSNLYNTFLDSENYEQLVKETVEQLLEENDLTDQDIQICFLSGTGVYKQDKQELSAIRSFLPEAALATTARIWGNMVDAGGIAELALFESLDNKTDLPMNIAIPDSPTKLVKEKSYGIILRSSPQGQFSALLVNIEK